ncbi:MAG: hypothetical protein WDA17_06100 [Sphaerochaetaceae bacterium]|jgi:hypothetical protein
MKHKPKSVVVIVILLCFLFPLGSVDFSDTNRLSDLRLLAMGSVSVALSGQNSSFIRNPAALYLNEKPLFRIGARYSELIKTTDTQNDPIVWIQNPTAAFDLLFSSRYLALSIGLNNTLKEREIDSDNLKFKAYNDSKIQITTSYGYKGASVGLSAQGGNRTERDVEIRKGSALSDYISRTYLERYTHQSENGQFFQSSLGFLFNYQGISLGFLTDSLFSLNYETNELYFDFSEIVDKSSIGLAYTSPEFNKDDELNRLVFTIATDFTNLGSNVDRSLNLGLEGKFQFTNTLSLALRTGYKEIRLVGKPYFSLDGSGILSFGIGTKVGNSAIDIAVEYPLSDERLVISAGLTWAL